MNGIKVQDVQEILTVRGQVREIDLAITTGAEAEKSFPMTGETGYSKSGVYYMWSDVDCYFLHKTVTGGTAASATTGIKLLANNMITIRITQNDIIAARAATTNGNVSFIRLNDTN